MENDKNSLILEISQVFVFAILNWAENQDDRFIDCWKKVFENEDYKFSCMEEGEERPTHKMSDLEAYVLLRKMGRQLADFIAVQGFVYSFESIRNNYHEFGDKYKEKFKKIKESILSGVADDDKLLKVMRNAFAHNTGEISRVEYDYEKDKFTIHFNNGSIELTKIELYRLLEIYAIHLDGIDQEKYKLEPARSLFIPIDFGIPSDELLRLTDRETGKKVPVDKRQKEALDGIVERIRDDGFIPNCTLKLFYPFKSNAYNNNAKISVLSIYVKDLIDYHDCNNVEFYEKCRFESYHALSDCTRPKDTLSVFMANMLFIMCANFKIEDIQECMDKIRPNVNYAVARVD